MPPRKGAIEQQRAGAAKTFLAPVQAAEKTAPPSPTNTSKRGTPRERGLPEDSPAKKARLSKEAAGDTENAQKADADTHNGKEPAADAEAFSVSAADSLPFSQGPAADTVLAVPAFENDADGGKKYNFRTRKLKPASSSVEGNLSEDDEGEEENEDDDEVEDEPKVTPTKIHPNLARIKDKVNRGRPVKPVSPKGIIF
jgi:hypothetical protein